MPTVGDVIEVRFTGGGPKDGDTVTRRIPRIMGAEYWYCSDSGESSLDTGWKPGDIIHAYLFTKKGEAYLYAYEGAKPATSMREPRERRRR